MSSFTGETDDALSDAQLQILLDECFADHHPSTHPAYFYNFAEITETEERQYLVDELKSILGSKRNLSASEIVRVQEMMQMLSTAPPTTSNFSDESESPCTSNNSTMPTEFYTNVLPRSTNLPNECYNKSVGLTLKGIERNTYNQFDWGDEDNPFTCKCNRVKSYNLGICADCGTDLGSIRLAEEERRAQIVKDEDIAFIVNSDPSDVTSTPVTNEKTATSTDPVKERREKRKTNMDLGAIGSIRDKHAHRLHNLGITTKALIRFAYAHDCWNWKTQDVVRDIIMPATSETRCRYADLPELKECFGPATVFMSHCWGATFGDLIGAACHGARTDRIVWIDIFAVRQWPGNVADLDFRGIIQRCKAVIVSFSIVDGLKEFLVFKPKMDAFLTTPEGISATLTIPTFRLWCIVEIAAAVKLEVPIVVKCGKIRKQRNDNIYIYNTEGGFGMMNNLSHMINAKESKCALAADFEREMNLVKLMDGGIDGVNKIVAGVVIGACVSIGQNILEIDAAVCGENESLLTLIAPIIVMTSLPQTDDELNSSFLLARRVLKVACSGGRVKLVYFLLNRWLGKGGSHLLREKKLGEKKLEVTMKNKKEVTEAFCFRIPWLCHVIDNSSAIWGASSGGHVEVLRMLLQVTNKSFLPNGVNVNANVVNKGGATALYQACFKGHLEVVGLLVQQKDRSSCSTKRHVFLFSKNTFIFVQQEDMSSCSTRRHFFLFNKKDL